MRKTTENPSQGDITAEISAKPPKSSARSKSSAGKVAPKKAANSAKKAEGSAKKQTKAAESKTSPKPKAEKSAESAAKSVRKSPDKKAEPTADISSKTPHVMKLVQPSEMINPVIIAGKSSIPKALRGVEPLSRMLRREAKQLDSALTGELVTVNLTAVAIDESAAEILRRFNACDCAVCVEELSRLTAEQVTARFVKLKPQDAEYGSDKLEELKQPVKKQVMQQMIRLVIRTPKRSFHG